MTQSENTNFTERTSSTRAERCSECYVEVKVMCFKGMGVCSENCRKRRDGDTSQLHTPGVLKEPKLTSSNQNHLGVRGKRP